MEPLWRQCHTVDANDCDGLSESRVKLQLFWLYDSHIQIELLLVH